MTTYTAKPTEPAQVDAERYEAPVATVLDDGTTQGTAGNQDAIEALGVHATRQNPWDPTAGQTCLLLRADESDPNPFAVLQNGDWLAKHADGTFEVLDPAAFAQAYDSAGEPDPGEVKTDAGTDADQTAAKPSSKISKAQ